MTEPSLLDGARRGDRLELIAAALLRPGDSRPVVLLPLRVVQTDGSLTERTLTAGIDLDTAIGGRLRPGSVVRFVRSPDGEMHVYPRYDDALEFLEPREPVQVLLNAMWSLHEHGVASEEELPRAHRMLARLLSHPDPKVRSEAGHVGEALG